LCASHAGAVKLCVVEGKSVEPMVVTVQPDGGSPMRVHVQGVAASAKLPDAPGPASVEVRGSLQFAGTIAVDKLPLKPREAVTSANAMLRLAAGTTGFDVHTRGKWVEGDLVIVGVRFKNVVLPCAGLTLDAVTAKPEQPFEPDGEVWVSAQPTITFRSAAGSGPSMLVENAEGLELQRIEKSGAWMRLKSRFPDGSSLTAWAKASDVKRLDRRRDVGELPIVPPPCTRTAQARAGEKLATVVVAPNTPVSADRLFRWATTSGTTPLTVRYRPGEHWVELIGVPGLAGGTECPEHSTVLDEAWLPSSAVQIPGEHSPDGGAP
jgi:hypothetical protein